MSEQPWSAFTPAQRRAMLCVLFLIATVSYVDRSILQILMEPIRQEFGTSDRMLGLLSGAPFALCYAALSIPFGRAADRGNRKYLLIAALALWSVMTGLCGLAPTLALLFLARMGVGAGEGGAVPPSHALLADYFPPDQRGRAFAIVNTAAVAGPLIAMIGGAWIAQHHGWRAAFLLTASASLPVALAAIMILREPPRAMPVATARIDGAGFAGDVRALLAKPSFLLIVAAMTSYSLFTAGPMIFAPAYLVRVLGLDLVSGGSGFALATGLGTVIGTIAGGYGGDRLTRRDARWLVWLPAIGMTLACPVAMAAFTVDTAMAMFLLIGIVAALLMGSLPVLYTAVQHICGSRRRALASAMLMAALHAIGMTIGPLATGAISDALAAGHGVFSLRYAMIAMTGVLVPAAALLVIAARSVREDAEA